jgi:glycosyltransferase involved in cell wall biosynthesis
MSETAATSTPGTWCGRPLRVLHGAYEIAGQGMMLTRALREWGCDARSLSYRVDWDGRVSDVVVDLDRQGGMLARGAAMLRTFARLGPKFDVFHFHFGTSFLPRLADVAPLKTMGKKIVFHFHGCEVRNRNHMLKNHRLATCTECDPFCRPRHQRWLLDRAARLADQVFYSTLDLAESVPGASHLPLAIESERWIEAGRAHPLPEPDHRDGVHGPVVVGHAPTNRLIKGTPHVLAAIETLKSEFPRLELRTIEKQPWAAMPEFLAGCDILIDQLMMGWYGLLAIEGMAEGKAVISYIRDDFASVHPDLPVTSADPATLVPVLRDLIRDPERRRALGVRGVEFARRHHDTRVVGEQLLRVYRWILGAGPPVETSLHAAAVEQARRGESSRAAREGEAR